MRPQRQSNDSWVGAIVGSLISAVCILGGYHYYVTYYVPKMAAAMMAPLNQQAERALEQSRRLQAEAAQRREDEARRKAEAAAAIERAQQEAAARMARKDAAWLAYYKPTAKCKDDPVTVDCANAHIRAKKAFEGSYKDAAGS